MGRAPRFRRRGLGALHTQFVDAKKLAESYPLQQIGGKGTPCTYDGKLKAIKEHVRRARAIRQGQQRDADACIVTWTYELVPFQGGPPIKRSEMTEQDAAMKNRSIRELGLLWRRAPY